MTNETANETTDGAKEAPAAFEVNLRHLHALSLLAADKDLREHLNGVWIDPETRPGRVLLFATNNTQIGLLHECDWGANAPLKPLFVPKAIIKQLPKEGTAAIGEDATAAVVRGKAGGLMLKWEPLRTSMPGWFNSVPQSVTDEVNFFDAMQLGLFAKVNAQLNSTKEDAGLLDIRWNEGGSVFVVRFPQNPDFLGLNSMFTQHAKDKCKLPSLLPAWWLPASDEAAEGLV
jgi:hypothetical protein